MDVDVDMDARIIVIRPRDAIVKPTVWLSVLLCDSYLWGQASLSSDSQGLSTEYVESITEHGVRYLLLLTASNISNHLGLLPLARPLQTAFRGGQLASAAGAIETSDPPRWGRRTWDALVPL